MTYGKERLKNVKEADSESDCSIKNAKRVPRFEQTLSYRENYTLSDSKSVRSNVEPQDNYVSVKKT